MEKVIHRNRRLRVFLNNLNKAVRRLGEILLTFIERLSVRLIALNLSLLIKNIKKDVLKLIFKNILVMGGS
jgi:hypothetical protein